VSEKVTFAADGFFATGSARLQPQAQAKIADLAEKVKGMALEVIIVVGHTDSTGNAAANQKLSVARAEAVKAYLVSKGVERNRVYTEGKGSSQPVADNRTAEGRSKNRRVEIVLMPNIEELPDLSTLEGSGTTPAPAPTEDATRLGRPFVDFVHAH